MLETNFIIGIAALLFAFPIGNYLVKYTKEELPSGKKWFKLIALGSIIGAIVNLILKNDALMFTFLFILIVTSRSLKKIN